MFKQCNMTRSEIQVEKKTVDTKNLIQKEIKMFHFRKTDIFLFMGGERAHTIILLLCT
jgi:hypothetical protein